MLRLKDVEKEELREVVRIATELYQKDQALLEATRERAGLLEAAAEVDLPAEYLERAAATLHERRVAAIQQGRRRRIGILAALGLALGLWGGWWIANPAPPAPAVYDFNAAPASQWTLDRNPETAATLTFEREAGRGSVAVLQVERFGTRSADGTYNANLNASDVPRSLAAYRTVAFGVRGEGLTQIRLYLEAGPTERWRSPALPVGPGWQEHRLRLDQFDYQTRRSPAETWQRVRFRQPGEIERMSFKAGSYVNGVDARGAVRIDDLRFE